MHAVLQETSDLAGPLALARLPLTNYSRAALFDFLVPALLREWVPTWDSPTHAQASQWLRIAREAGMRSVMIERGGRRQCWRSVSDWWGVWVSPRARYDGLLNEARYRTGAGMAQAATVRSAFELIVQSLHMNGYALLIRERLRPGLLWDAGRNSARSAAGCS